MRSLVAALVAALAVPACSPEGATPPTEAPVTTSAPTPTTPASETTAVPDACPPAPYLLEDLPSTVTGGPADPDDVEIDDFTSIAGSNSTFWVDAEGQAAVALVRGALPPQQFPSDRGEVDVSGSRGVAGPFPDGRWVVAWFNEPGDRCDQYTLVFYPPVAPSEVEAALESMERVPG